MDPSSLTIPDHEHSLSEERYVTVGRAFAGKLLVVVHTDRGNNIRIISARAASRRERKFYEKDTCKLSRESIQHEYDFSQGVRGKYVRRYAQGTNVVVLEPDVARVFSNSEAVNASLRKIIREKASVR